MFHFKKYVSTRKIGRVRAIFVQIVKTALISNKFMPFDFLNHSNFAQFMARGINFFVSGHISIIVSFCYYKHKTPHSET